jgi:glycosyltransferase involved in cell wall biosynthesis
MRVCIGSPGRFYTFDLARQMERLGHLAHMYTGYPRFKVDRLPREKVSTCPWLIGTSMALGRLGLLDWLTPRLDYPAAVSFDHWTAARLEQCDVFHCLSQFGLGSHRLARERYGALTVCDRGSTHMLHQCRIMAEEFDRLGVPFRPTNPRLVERELAEYEFCDIIFVPSELAYRTFLEHGVSASKLRKNPFGADPGLFRPVPKQDDIFRVVYVGTLSIRKGIPYLLEALAGLRLPKFELWLIGTPLAETRPFLARYEGGFSHLGVIPHTELYRYYSQGSVFVMASIEEGLAMVQAQAMACGLPVVATTNTGAEDLFTDGVEGFIVPIRDPEAIRERVLMLYRDRELRDQMARAAIERVRSIGGWNDYGHRAARFYREALAEMRGDDRAHSAL